MTGRPFPQDRRKIENIPVSVRQTQERPVRRSREESRRRKEEHACLRKKNGSEIHRSTSQRAEDFGEAEPQEKKSGGEKGREILSRSHKRRREHPERKFVTSRQVESDETDLREGKQGQKKIRRRPIGERWERILR